ncbi:MAG TPA: hypothetical protein DCQ29_01990 [Chitinophagaceae bacterium]|nr:hypothetical protein [Chitinophagaceae bacterium]
MKHQSFETIHYKVKEEKNQSQEVMKLLFGPENEIQKKQSNQYLDRILLEIELRDGKSKICDVIRTEPRVYEAIFHKAWFYRLADMLGVNRCVMDNYVKPQFVREFFMKFVYARLGFKVFRELKCARMMARAYDAKLFQFLKDEYFNLIETIASQIYSEMEGKTFEEFTESYCIKHKIPVQQCLSL